MNLEGVGAGEAMANAPISSAAPAADSGEDGYLIGLVDSNKTDEEIELAVEKGLRSEVRNAIEKTDMTQMTAMHLVAFLGRRGLMTKLMSRPRFLNDINAINAEGRTPLHMAALTGNLEIVELLLTQLKLRGAVEDKKSQSAFEIALELEWHDIVRVLLENRDVKYYIDARRADRAVYGNGTNAILVAAALIASITFAGWLQPPLSYQQYYQYPRNETMASAPPNDFQQYAAISEHLPVKIFWITNSLSFYCAIAAILSGAAALVPRGSLHELAEGRRLRGAVYLAAFSLSWAVLFVFAAFTAAGFASLPPIMKYEVYMIVTLVIGFLICLHGFSSARISDPFVFSKYSFIIDPTFYLSKLSGVLEWWCECFPERIHYQSFESRINYRRELYKQPSLVQTPTNGGAQKPVNNTQDGSSASVYETV